MKEKRAPEMKVFWNFWNFIYSLVQHTTKLKLWTKKQPEQNGVYYAEAVVPRFMSTDFSDYNFRRNNSEIMEIKDILKKKC
jgi:hypothetical protein